MVQRAINEKAGQIMTGLFYWYARHDTLHSGAG